MQSPPTASPRVSVIIPCHNLGRYLAEAISSVTAQTFLDFELIVVDDGSDDPETVRALEEIERRGVRVIHTENRGLSAARNQGIAAANGEFICSLDADDRLRPEWLERALDKFRDDPSLDFVTHWLHAFGEEEWTWQPERCDLGALLDRNAVNGAALFRRAIVARIGGFDESMREGCEDWEFWIRAVWAGCRGAILTEVMYDYRRRSDSMSAEMHRGDTHARLYGSIVEKHREAFAAFLPDLMLHREYTIATLSTSIDNVTEEIAMTLVPTIAERRLELERARARLEGARERAALHERNARLDSANQGLQSECDRLIGDAADLTKRVAALESSASWRVTAPLRKVFDLLGLGRRS